TRLLEEGIAISGQMPVLHVGGRMSRITWPSFSVDRDAPLDDLGTIGEYRSLSARRQLTCVLGDGALLQMSYDFDRDVILTHRLCFYPCPIRLADDETELGDGLLDVIDSILEGEVTGLVEPRLRTRSPIRFDF